MPKISFGAKPTPAAETFATMLGMNGANPNQTGIEQIEITKLVPYDNQPFKSYSLQKLKELAEDIKQNGVLSPIIVRPYVGRYQILAGHNRTQAARLAGLETVPCIVKDVDDNTAKLIMVNTNLNQREELLPSEKAFAYKMQMEAMKQQGKRTDLQNKSNLVYNVDKVDTAGNVETKSSDSGENKFKSNLVYNVDKVDTAEIIAINNSDSRANIFNYIRLTYLIKPLLDMTDEKILPFRAAVNLSYLKENEQSMLYEYLTANNASVTLDQSQLLKMQSKDNEFGYATINQVFTGYTEGRTVKKDKKKQPTVKMKYERLQKFIDIENVKTKDVEEYILKALEFYEKHKEQAE